MNPVNCEVLLKKITALYELATEEGELGVERDHYVEYVHGSCDTLKSLLIEGTITNEAFGGTYAARLLEQGFNELRDAFVKESNSQAGEL